MLEDRLEDLNYRIAQYGREEQREMRLQRRRKALLASHAATHARLEEMNDVLLAEEAKLELGAGLFHRGLERQMVEDLIAVENLAVFKAACQYDALEARLGYMETEVTGINGFLERHRDHQQQKAMLEEWREDVYGRAERGARERNALLHRRLEVWLQVADREDDLVDLEAAGAVLEDTLISLEASISAGTKVRIVQKRDLAVLANLQPPRTKQFNLLEMVREAKEAYHHGKVLIDTLQGVEHLKVHVRNPNRLLNGLMEALLLDFYESERPWHALREVHEQHKYMKQIRQALLQRRLDVEKEIDDLREMEDELLLLAIDRRLKQRSSLNRW